ncbi:MAG: cytidine deaminase [Elusimicrobiota bacterium]
MKPNYLKLINVAKKAAKNAYAPYSKFKVGAAALGGSGNIYSGANIENASYGLTVCAERVAIFKAVSEGEKTVKAVAVVWSAKGFATPCGACRQVIAEFAKNADIIISSEDGKHKIMKLPRLLPDSFSLKNKQQ